MSQNFKTLTNSELISQYGDLVKELQDRKIIRTKNVVGDLGERFAIDYFTQTEELENLSDAPTSTKSIDAIGDLGNKYAIKSITRNTTGVIYGLPDQGSDDTPKKLFDFLLIVKFKDSYEVQAIYELTWEEFLKYKKWHSTVGAWNITLNKKIKETVKVIYELI